MLTKLHCAECNETNYPETPFGKHKPVCPNCMTGEYLKAPGPKRVNKKDIITSDEVVLQFMSDPISELGEDNPGVVKPQAQLKKHTVTYR